MEPQFRQLQVRVWTYVEGADRNYPGFHLSADPQSCHVLEEWLSQAAQSGKVIARTIPLQKRRGEKTSPVSGSLRCYYFEKWKLHLGPERPDLREMHLDCAGDIVTLDITWTKLPELVQGLRSMADGVGDYSIRPAPPLRDRSPKCSQLWFWPHFDGMF